jgi:hypothetical protein
MEVDLDTFLVAVYCVVDELYRAHAGPAKPARPGHQPELSDSEVLTLQLVAQWQTARSERAFVAYAARHWRAYFPRLLDQSAFNRRARDLQGVLARLGDWSRQYVLQVLPLLPLTGAYEVLDGVPVPLMRRCRGRRHRCFGAEADMGRGGSDKERYYGVKLLVGVDAIGFVTGWVMGPASTEEHWLAEALCRWRIDPTAPVPTADQLAPILGPAHRQHGRRLGPNGPLWGQLSAGQPPQGPSLADLGFRGHAWRRHWQQAYGHTVLLKSDYRAGPARGRAVRWFNGLRQTVERTFSTLHAVFGLAFPRARTAWGLRTRLAAKLSAYNLALSVNLLLGRPPHAFLNPFA